MRRTFRDFFEDHVQGLQHYWFQSGARQHYSPPRYGQKEGRRRSARDQKCAADFRAQPARAPHLGAGTETLRPAARDCARAQNNQQERRLPRAEKSRRDLGATDFEFFGRARLSRADDFPFGVRNCIFGSR